MWISGLIDGRDSFESWKSSSLDWFLPKGFSSDPKIISVNFPFFYFLRSVPPNKERSIPIFTKSLPKIDGQIDFTNNGNKFFFCES